MKKKYDITNKIEDQDEPEDFRLGITQITDWLYLGGEEDVCQVLNEVDVWIDLRHFGDWNRTIYLPDSVLYIRMPFMDGDLKKAREVLPQAKMLSQSFKSSGKKVLISCHAGASRSATLALWILAEELGDYDEAWLKIYHLRKNFQPDDNFFDLLVDIKNNIKG